MADKEIISVNPIEKTELEFEISTAGLNKKDSRIRFIITNKNNDDIRLFNCKSTDSQNWSVVFPPMMFNTEHKYTFKMECIIYNYYFEIAQGDINFIHETPKVVVKKDKKSKKPITESISDNTDQTAPTNALLKTERKPKDIHGEKVSDRVDPVQIEDIASSITPGEGIQEPAIPDQVNLDDNPSIAKTIITSIIGKHKTPKFEGSLFKKDENGKFWVPGLENAEQKEKMIEKQIKVQNILLMSNKDS